MTTETKQTDMHELTISTEKARSIYKAIFNIHPGLADSLAMAQESVDDGSFKDAVVVIRIAKK